jgi:hypothetical protein
MRERVDMKKFILLLLSCLLFIISSIGFTGCNTNDITESDIYFPTPEEPLNAYPDALTEGQLIFDGEYILLSTGFLFFTEEMLLLWPYGYSVEVEKGNIHILNDNGDIVANVGDHVKMGGGQIPVSHLENLVGKSLPDDWDGTCWLVSEIVND